MLIIKCKLSETIQIGDDIVLTIRYIDRSQVKIGIAAPQDVVILREELLEASTNSPE